MNLLFPKIAIFLGALLFSQAFASTNFGALKSGDVIFHRSDSAQSEAICLMTKSQATHVGVIEIKSNEKAVVLEATNGGVRETSLAEWIKDGVGGKYSIYRHNKLASSGGLFQFKTPEQYAAEVIAGARSYLGSENEFHAPVKEYDPYFSYDNHSLYCSELVYKAYGKAAISIGKPKESLSSLLKDNYGYSLQDLSSMPSGFRKKIGAILASRWEGHPACQSHNSKTLKECLPYLAVDPMITPVGLLKGGGFAEVKGYETDASKIFQPQQVVDNPKSCEIDSAFADVSLDQAKPKRAEEKFDVAEGQPNKDAG